MADMTTMDERKRMDRIPQEVRASKELTDKNRDDILKYFTHLEAKDRSPATVIKVWNHLHLLVRRFPGKDFRDYTRGDFEQALVDRRIRNASAILGGGVIRSRPRRRYEEPL